MQTNLVRNQNRNRGVQKHEYEKYWNDLFILESMFDVLNPLFFDTEMSKSNKCISEKEEAYIIEIAAPGAKKEDITITLQDNTINIEIPRNQEWATGQFNSVIKKSFSVAKGITENNISALYKDGILVITVQKLQPTSLNAKTITVV